MSDAPRANATDRPSHRGTRKRPTTSGFCLKPATLLRYDHHATHEAGTTKPYAAKVASPTPFRKPTTSCLAKIASRSPNASASHRVGERPKMTSGPDGTTQVFPDGVFHSDAVRCRSLTSRHAERAEERRCVARWSSRRKGRRPPSSGDPKALVHTAQLSRTYRIPPISGLVSLR